MKEAIAQKDADARAFLEKSQREINERIEQGEKDRESLKADYETLAKDRVQELERIKNQLNEQAKTMEQRKEERDRLQQMLQSGQGNSAQIEKYVPTYDKRLNELSRKLEEGKEVADRKRPREKLHPEEKIVSSLTPRLGVPAEIGKQTR